MMQIVLMVMEVVVIAILLWIIVILAASYSRCTRKLRIANEDYATLDDEVIEKKKKLIQSVRNRDLLRGQVDNLRRMHTEACEATATAEAERAYLQDLLARTNTDRNRALEMARVLGAYRDKLLLFRDAFVNDTGVLIAQAKEVTDWPIVPVVPAHTSEEDPCET